MQMKRIGLAAAALVWLAVPVRSEILEIRGGAGITASNNDQFEDRVNAAGTGGVHSDEFQNYNADIFFNLPVSPIGVGVRHEWLRQNDSAGGTDFDLKINNLSLLVDLRLIDTKVYLARSSRSVTRGASWTSTAAQRASKSRSTATASAIPAALKPA